jgi:hypothetical protein
MKFTCLVLLVFVVEGVARSEGSSLTKCNVDGLNSACGIAVASGAVFIDDVSSLSQKAMESARRCHVG